MFEQNDIDGHPKIEEFYLKIEKGSDNEEDEIGKLYANHVIKEEMVIGPEKLQQVSYSNDRSKSENKIICIGCEKEFKGKIEFARHIKEHEGLIREVYFKCKECSYQTAAQESFERHMLFHDESRRYVCDVCGYRFTEKTRLMKHSFKHKGASLLKKQRQILNKTSDQSNSQKETTSEVIVPYCNLYKYKYPDNKTKGELVNNTILENNDNEISNSLFICNSCNKQFMKKCDLEKHVKCHEITHTKFSCKNCDYRTRTQGVLERHQKFHDETRQFVCNVCFYRYKEKSDLTSHMKTHEKPFPCNLCEKKFSHKFSLKMHLRAHKGVKPYSCHICDYACTTKSYLKTHLAIHTGEKPHSCPYCFYKCLTSSNLQIHLKTHTGEKPFTCSVCDHKFAQKSQMKSHMKIHTGEKPFSCSYCGYRCRSNATLVDHVRSHTGERPYTCSVCEFKFTRKCIMKRHLRIHSRKDKKIGESSVVSL